MRRGRESQIARRMTRKEAIRYENYSSIRRKSFYLLFVFNFAFDWQLIVSELESVNTFSQ